MKSETPRPDPACSAVFDEALPTIHQALVGYYRFMEEEAEAFEDTLCIWFNRLSRRATAMRSDSPDLHAVLVFVACKYARAFQIAKFRTVQSEEHFTMTLARPAEEVAMELLRRPVQS